MNNNNSNDNKVFLLTPTVHSLARAIIDQFYASPGWINRFLSLISYIMHCIIHSSSIDFNSQMSEF